MIGSLQLLSWALDLKGISPVEKLVAIYFAMHAAGAPNERAAFLDIDIIDAAHWVGCKKEDVVVSLAMLGPYGVNAEEVDLWRYRATLRLPDLPSVESRSRGEETWHIYVVGTASGVKIGITRNPPARFKSLRTASPEAMMVHFVASGPRRIIGWAEARCHGDLRTHHIRGEWFACTPELATAVVRAVLEEGGVVLPGKDHPG